MFVFNKEKSKEIKFKRNTQNFYIKCDYNRPKTYNKTLITLTFYIIKVINRNKFYKSRQTS